jgi:hypothetical protein
MTLAALSGGFMDPSLEAVEGGIASSDLDQILVHAVLDEALGVERDDPIGAAHGREPMRDDDDGAALGDLGHVTLDHPLALVIERARRLVEDEDAGIGDQRPRALARAPSGARLSHCRSRYRRPRSTAGRRPH